MTTKWVDPLVGVSRPPKRRLTAEDWTKNGRKEKIARLHRSGMTCSDIRETMKEEDAFDASIASYKARFKAWGLRDHFNEKQRNFILRERARRGRMPVFRYIDTNQKVDAEKVQRLWDSRGRYAIPRDECFSPGLIAVSTPSSPDLVSPDPAMAIVPRRTLGIAEPEPNLITDAESVDVPNIDIPDITEDDVELFRTLTAPGHTSPRHSIHEGNVINICSVRSANLITSPVFCMADATLLLHDIEELVMRVLNFLKIRLDYRGQNGSGRLSSHIVDQYQTWTQTSSLAPSRCQSPWRRICGNISPMTPRSIESFMKSSDVSEFLLQVNQMLTASGSVSALALEPPSNRVLIPDACRTDEYSPEGRTKGPLRDDTDIQSLRYHKLAKLFRLGKLSFFHKHSLMEQRDVAIALQALNTLVLPYVSPDGREFRISEDAGGTWTPIVILTRDEVEALEVACTYLDKAYAISPRSSKAQISRARDLLQSAISIPVLRNIFGWKSRSFVDANYELCRCIMILDPTPLETLEAQRMMQDISRRYKELGIRTWRTRRRYNTLASELIHQGRYTEALDVLHVALNGRDLALICQRWFSGTLLGIDTSASLVGIPPKCGKGFGYTARESVRIFIQIYNMQGRYQESIALKEALLNHDTLKYGYTDCAYAYDLSQSYVKNRKFERALHVLRYISNNTSAFVYSDSKIHLLPTQDFLICRIRIAECLFELDRLEEARITFEKVCNDIIAIPHENIDGTWWRLLGSLFITFADITFKKIRIPHSSTTNKV